MYVRVHISRYSNLEPLGFVGELGKFASHIPKGFSIFLRLGWSIRTEHTAPVPKNLFFVLYMCVFSDSGPARIARVARTLRVARSGLLTLERLGLLQMGFYTP